MERTCAKHWLEIRLTIAVSQRSERAAANVSRDARYAVLWLKRNKFRFSKTVPFSERF
jgi:hypothetical protein